MVIDVELRGVTKRFADIVAVDNVSIQILKGEFFSLLGPSGCGKTTTLRTIAGFEDPSEGEVFISGQSMAGVPPFKRPTNMVFQHLALFPHLSVEENVAFGLKVKRLAKQEIRQRASKFLEIVRLSGLEKRKISQLSGGQQQRVAIARALVTEPTVLLLDEPLGPLDLRLRLEMQEELKRIQREVGTTFVYVTHDQTEALSLSNRVAVMISGRIEQVGTPLEVYEKPRNHSVAEFMGETNMLGGRYLDGAVEIDGLSVRVTSQASKGTDIIFSIRSEKISIGKTLSGPDNVFKGTVRGVTYRGSDSVYDVQLSERIIIKVRSTNLALESIYRVGDEVFVGWDIDKALLISSLR